MATKTQIIFPSKYTILQDVVKDYPGILESTGELLQELNRHPQNWDFIIKEMRSYALKHFYLHDSHEKGLKAIETIFANFLAIK